MEEINLDRDILKELGYDIKQDNSGHFINNITKNGKIITEIEIPSEFKAYGDTYRIIGIQDGTFYDCKSLQNVIIPNTVKAIASRAFYHCTSLKNIDIPNSVKFIGIDVFYGCKSLQNLTIPESVNLWLIDDSFRSGGMRFEGCESLENISFLTNNIKFITREAHYEDSKITHYSAKEITGFIGFGGFSGCISLKSINIPNGIQRIQPSSFYGCKSLQNVIIPDSVKFIGASALGTDGSLKNLQIPKSVIEIQDWAFTNVDIVYYTGSASGSPWRAREVTNNKFTYNKKIAELRQENQ